MSDSRQYNVFMNNRQGRKWLCGRLGIHWTRELDETGELYCERCETVVKEQWRWSRKQFALVLATDALFFALAAAGALRGHWLFGLVFLSLGLANILGTARVYVKQQTRT